MRSRRLKVSLFSNIKFWVNIFALYYTFNVNFSDIEDFLFSIIKSILGSVTN